MGLQEILDRAAKGKGECPYCHFAVKLRQDGKLRKHKLHHWDARIKARPCPGGDNLPSAP